jgi:hypothetical protein
MGSQAAVSVSAAARQGMHSPLQLYCSTAHTQSCAIAGVQAAQHTWPCTFMHDPADILHLVNATWLTVSGSCRLDSWQLLRLHPPCRMRMLAAAAGKDAPAWR